MANRLKDLTGQRFFRLVAISYLRKENDGHSYWKCQCDCGNITVVRTDSLLNGHAKSCGCYLKECYKYREKAVGWEYRKRLYGIWWSMVDRCHNPDNNAYSNYGGRSITVCEEWRCNFLNFKKWAIANGYENNKNRKEQSLDRIDVNGNYEPSNCRWADCETQNYNKRDTQRVTVNGIEMTLKEISDTFKISMTCVRSRYQRYKKNLISADELVCQETLVNKPQQILITVNGVTKNLSEWEKETGKCRKTIANRYRAGKRTYEELFS